MTIDLDLTPKQKIAFDYLNDDITTEILFGGAAGSGKSFFGCAWLIINCVNYPGTRWLMGRSKLKALKQTTLNTFFEITALWGLTSEHYNYNQQSGEITFYNGSQIILKDLFTYPSDPNFDSLGSLEITGAFIDEVNQISEKAKNIVASRMRYKLDEYGLIPKLFCSCNPARNWCYEEFYKKDKDNTIEEYKQFIQALVTDNPFISEHYITQLEKLDELSKKRLLYGMWEYQDDAAIINYDSVLDIFNDYKFIKEDKALSKDYYISCDVARKGKDKAVILLWYKFDIIKIQTMDISLINEIVDAIKTIKKEYRINNKNIVIDGDGVGGGVVDYLPGAVDFINNSRPFNKDNYQNLKTQCYFRLAEMINEGMIGMFEYSTEEKEKIVQELSVIKRKNIDKDGKIQIIGKDEIKKVIGRSPDYSDAMMMRMHFTFKKTKVAFKIG
jgi:phage terminase large subunit